MSRPSNISVKDKKKAYRLRDNSLTVAQYRKAITVILMSDDWSFNSKQVSDLLGVSRKTIFKYLSAIKTEGATGHPREA
jgi:predicted transcriptional regulator YheO